MEDPRDFDDNLGTMVCFHRRYDLGDKRVFKFPSIKTPQDLKEHLEDNPHVELPLFLYDHSILAMSTRSFIGRAHHAEWDSGQVGIIYVTHDRIRIEYKVGEITDEMIVQVKKRLNEEVEEYDRYLRDEDEEE